MDREARARIEQSNGGVRAPLACYANYFEVGHNAFEFLIDAGQVEPQSGEIRFTNRIAVSPVQAKLLSELLQRSIVQFETQHDEIPNIAEEEFEEFELTSLADFERRALDARRRQSGGPAQSKER